MSNIDKQALRERYSEKPAPKCHICGSVMTIQRAGAGGIVYGCTGRIDKDGEGYKFAEGRDFADDHYARSRVTVADESDPDVLALLDELEASQSENERLAKTLIERNGEPVEGLVKRVTELEEIATDYGMKFQRAQDALKQQSLLHKSEMEAAEKRIAELSHHLQSAHAFVEHTEAFGYEASNGILCCGDAQWNIDESKSALAAAGKGE